MQKRFKPKSAIEMLVAAFVLNNKELVQLECEIIAEARNCLMKQTGEFMIHIHYMYVRINNFQTRLVDESSIYALLALFPERFEILEEKELDEYGLEKQIRVRRLKDIGLYPFDGEWMQK